MFVETRHYKNVLIVIITLFSTMQVLMEIKQNSNFDTHERFPFFKAIFGDSAKREEEVIEDVENLQDKLETSILVDSTLTPF